MRRDAVQARCDAPEGSHRASAAMTRPRFVWHLGFMKTGTTFLQAVLWRNRPTLARTTTVFNCRDRDWSLRNAAIAHCQSPSAETDAQVTKAARAFARRTLDQGHTTAFLSDENLVGYRLYDRHGDCFSKTAALLPILTAAAEAEGLASEFQLYTRDMPAWLASAYNQEIKQMRETRSYADWTAGLPFEQDWSAQHQRLSAVTPAPVTFRDMKADLKEGRMVGAHLLDRAGLDPALHGSLKMPRGQNESLSPGALEFMRQINATRMQERQLVFVRRTLLANPHLFADFVPDND